MSTKIIEKDVRPPKGKGQDNQVNTLSENQVDCYQADPNDFVVQQPDKGVNAEVPAHGQHGDSKADHRKLLQKAAADKGKSPFRKPE